jgi:hypothetical protein
MLRPCCDHATKPIDKGAQSVSPAQSTASSISSLCVLIAADETRATEATP